MEDDGSLPLNVLVVEDNHINEIIAKKIFTKLGHSVQSVNNGKEAIQVVESQDFDAVFMDLQMVTSYIRKIHFCSLKWTDLRHLDK